MICDKAAIPPSQGEELVVAPFEVKIRFLFGVDSTSANLSLIPTSTWRDNIKYPVGMCLEIMHTVTTAAIEV